MCLMLFCLVTGCRGDKAVSDYVPGEMLVVFRDGALTQEGSFTAYSLTKLNETFNLKSKKRISENLYLFNFPKDTDMSKVLRMYKKSPFVEHAELNHKVHARGEHD